MAVKTTKRFEASDGTEFESKEMAEKYDTLKSAETAFETATNAYKFALAETTLTKDGKPFEFGILTYYYYVRHYIGAFPHVVKLSASRWDARLDDDCRVCINTLNENGQRQDFYIHELYADVKNAYAALVIEQELAIKELTERMNEAKTRAQ